MMMAKNALERARKIHFKKRKHVDYLTLCCLLVDAYDPDEEILNKDDMQQKINKIIDKFFE